MKELNKYYNDISTKLTAGEMEKKQFIDELSDSINQYISEHPDVSTDDIISEFGTPDQIAEQFLVNEVFINKDVNSYKNKISIKKNILRMVFIFLALVFIIILAFYANEYRWSKSNRNGYYSEEIIEY